MDVNKWREDFPSCGRAVYMNHAGVSPISRRVATAISEFAEEAL